LFTFVDCKGRHTSRHSLWRCPHEYKQGMQPVILPCPFPLVFSKGACHLLIDISYLLILNRYAVAEMQL